MRHYNSQSADISAHDPLGRMAGMRRLCHHSVILVDHPPPRRLLALAQGFPVSHPDTALDRNVDGCGRDHRFVARPDVLHHSVDMAPRSAPLPRGVVDLQSALEPASALPNWEACRSSSPDMGNSAWQHRAYARVSAIPCIWDTCVRCWPGAWEPGWWSATV